MESDEEGDPQQEQQQEQQEGKVEYGCKHCNKVMSGTNEDRMKKHLTNPSACTFLSSNISSNISSSGCSAGCG